MSATTGLSTGNQIWFYGTEGAIYMDQHQKIFAGRRGDKQFSEVPNPLEEQAYYRVVGFPAMTAGATWTMQERTKPWH